MRTGLGQRGDLSLRFALSDDQEFFRSTAAKFLAREFSRSTIREIVDGGSSCLDKNVWMQCAELGWSSMFAPEALGGGSISGNALEDMAIVAEEAGRVLAPLPLLGVNLAVMALSEAGGDQLRATLESLTTGQAIAAWALEEPEGRWHPDDLATTAEVDRGHVIVTGRKSLVQYGAEADYLLLTCRTGARLTQLLIPSASPGVTVKPLRSLDLLHSYAEIDLNAAVVPLSSVVGEVGEAAREVARQLHYWTALQSAETIGAMQQAFDFTVEYTRNRYAFGRPIGSFQAVKHRIADMLTSLELCKGTAEALTEQNDERSIATAISTAKAYIGDYGPCFLQECTQILGGIGLTWEHDAHRYLRRVTSNRAVGGTPEQHKERLCALLEELYYAPS